MNRFPVFMVVLKLGWNWARHPSTPDPSQNDWTVLYASVAIDRSIIACICICFHWLQFSWCQRPTLSGFIPTTLEFAFRGSCGYIKAKLDYLAETKRHLLPWVDHTHNAESLPDNTLFLGKTNSHHRFAQARSTSSSTIQTDRTVRPVQSRTPNFVRHQ